MVWLFDYLGLQRYVERGGQKGLKENLQTTKEKALDLVSSDGKTLGWLSNQDGIFK
jgi:hypothetical protein